MGLAEDYTKSKVKAMFTKVYILIFRRKKSDVVRVMMFNATFNNISAIFWRSVLLTEEIRIARENHRPAASH
jgi:hypothetical protein